jgi:hypothetical protein
MTEHLATRTVLRPARPEDFDYCARLYFEGMENIIKDLNLNMEAQAAGFRQRWDVTQVALGRNREAAVLRERYGLHSAT